MVEEGFWSVSHSIQVELENKMHIPFTGFRRDLIDMTTPLTQRSSEVVDGVSDSHMINHVDHLTRVWYGHGRSEIVAYS
jgi:hypothetical protein